MSRGFGGDKVRHLSPRRLYHMLGLVVVGVHSTHVKNAKSMAETISGQGFKSSITDYTRFLMSNE